MKIEIKSRFNQSVLFAYDSEDNSLKLTVEAAVKSGANLYDANLYGANLYGANLSGANLYGADLHGANLYDANLYGANLYGANLRGANLYGANLYGANLSRADLSRADLSGADLRGANLSRANLRGANLSGADGDNWQCDGKHHHITNVGSENGTLELYSCGDKGWLLKRGCFTGSKKEFLDAVNKTHGNSEHGRQYRAIVELFCGEQGDE